jgi:hypothetical protein
MAELEEIKNQKICHLRLELPLEELKRLMEFWFNNPNSDYNIGKNFEALQQKHERYLEKIDEFVQGKLNIPSTLEDLQKELENLGRAQNDLAKALGDVVIADQSFTYSINTLITGLQNNKMALEKVIKESDYPELKPQFDEMLKSIQSWIDKAAYAKAFVLEAGRKRSLVFGIVSSRLELSLEAEFARLSGQKLGDITDQIDAILLARDLLIEIENWWFSTAVLNGFGGGYLFKYLQFERPLLIIRADYAQGLSFEQRIEALSSLPPVTKTALKDELQTRLNTLKAEIDKLVSGGWQPLLTRQKLIVKARETKISTLSSDCKSAIKEYSDKASDVQTLLDFRIAEEAFKKHIDACSVPAS